MFKRNRKNKKKGSLIIEQLLVFPIMIGLIWLIMQMIIFVYSNNQVNTAANETAHLMSQMLRGTDKKIDQIDLHNATIIRDEALKKLMVTTQQNKFIMLSEDNRGGTTVEYLKLDSATMEVSGFTEYNASVSGEREDVLFVLENKSLCEDTLKDGDKRRVICIYTEEGVDPSGSLKKNSQQVAVRVKAPFYLIGSIIPGVDDKISLYGNGVSTKEIPGRYQYY